MKKPWYYQGLRFTCTQCGNCCRGKGTVRVTVRDIRVLARRLNMTVKFFRKQYTRKLRNGTISLKEKKNDDCVFWHPTDGCRVYSDRPRQCRTWPFWKQNATSPKSWDTESKTCPGMNHGHLFSFKSITHTVRHDGT